jgi:hypothetical protein
LTQPRKSIKPQHDLPRDLAGIEWIGANNEMGLIAGNTEPSPLPFILLGCPLPSTSFPDSRKACGQNNYNGWALAQK